MSAVNLKVRSGNRVIVTFDGIQIGMLQNLRSNDDYSPEPASGVGDIHVQEWVPTMARHTLSASTMVLFTGAMRQAGISLENGDHALEGLVFDIVAMGKDDGAELRKYTGCSMSSGDVEINKHAIMIANAQFNALDVSGTAA